MGVFVGHSEVAAYLGITSDDDYDPVVARLIDQVEALFSAHCDRSETPFAEDETARVDRLDGTGRTTLFLPYPVADLVSVKLGYDSSDPDETLDVDDQTALVWTVGSRRLMRVDGGRFGAPGAPGYVTVTYDTQADAPEDVKPAILRGIAALYNQRGSEGSSTEAIGGYRADVAQALDGDPVWKRAVELHRRVAW